MIDWALLLWLLAPAGDPPAIEEHVEVEAQAPATDDPAAFGTRLDLDEARARGEDLADVLRRVPGARVRDYGGLGSYATMSLRGSTAEQVTVLVDGAPANRAWGGAVDLGSIPATSVERLTVYRGFAPARFGMAGVGGAVDIRSRGPDAAPHSRIDLVAGELDTARLAADLALPTVPGGRLAATVESLTSDGDYEFLDTGGTEGDPGDDVTRARTNNDVEQRSARVSHALEEVGGGTLAVAAGLVRVERGAPGVGSVPDGIARTEDALDDLDIGWRREAPAGGLALELAADAFHERQELDDPGATFGVARDRLARFSGGGASAVLRTTRFERQAWLARIEARHEEARVHDALLAEPDRGGATRSRVALTVEDTIGLGRTVLAPAARVDWRADRFEEGGAGTLPVAAGDVDDTEWAAKLGVAHPLGSRSSLRASVGRFSRVPSLLELFGDRGALRGNPNLAPERGFVAEAGFDLARAPRGWRIDAEAATFWRTIDDLIHFTPVAQGVAVATNVGRAEVAGLEAGLTAAVPGVDLDLAASASWRHATDRSETFAHGKPLPYEPEALASFAATWRPGPFLAGWDVTWTGSNSTTLLDDPAYRIPGRVIHDARAGWRAARGLALGIDVRNVFDRRVVDVLRYPLPGRVVLLHVGFTTPGLAH